MIFDPQQAVSELVTDFSADSSLSELDQAILEHCIDEWPMGALAKKHGTTPTALHRRKRELLLALRDYSLKRGITGSRDVFHDQTTTPVARTTRRQSRSRANMPSAIKQSASSPPSRVLSDRR